MVSANVLKNYIFFKGFTDAQLKKMASIASEESYPAGTQLYKKGDPARSFFICKEGKMVMVMDNNMGPHQPPMQITVDIITKGESMGWSSVVDPYLYTLGALCIDHTKLIAFDATAGTAQWSPNGCADTSAGSPVVDHSLVLIRI